MVAPRRWLVQPPASDAGAEIARLLREEVARPAGPVAPGSWSRLEARLFGKRRRRKWGLLGVALPVLAVASGIVYEQRQERVEEPASISARHESKPPAAMPGAAVEAGTEPTVVAPRAAVEPPGAALVKAEGEAPPVGLVETAPVPTPAEPRRPRPARTSDRRPRMTAAPASSMETAQPAGAPAPAAPVPPAPDLDAVEREASEAHRAGDGQAAARGYLQLARTTGLRAESALYKLGLVRLHLESDVQGALEAWNEYRRRFPRGQLGMEVDLSILGALERAGREDELVRESRAFLSARPESERAGDVHALLGALLQRRGDCASALPHLEAGARAPLPVARADEIAYRVAMCLRSLGRADEATDALRAYLDRFPRGRFRDSVERALNE